MAGKLSTVTYTLIAIASVVAIVSLAPPLTQNRSVPDDQLQGLDQELTHAEGRYNYCSDQMSGVNCACFAKTAGQVLDNQNPRAIGWAYADPWRLAKMQAMDTCAKS